MLTGHHLSDLPDARPGRTNSTVLDDWPIIFKDYEKHHYVTMFSDDDPEWGAFQFRLTGFRNQPTDKYLLPFMYASKDNWDWAHKYAFEYIKR